MRLPPATLHRRGLLSAALAMSAIGLGARIARAGQPMILLVGAAPGSAVDRTARSFAPFLERHLPRTRVAVLNVPGDAGLAAYRTLAMAEANGTTVGFISTPSLPARVVDRGGLGLMEQIRLLGGVHKEPITIVSPSATPLTSARDIFQRAGADADAVAFGTPAQGSPAHLAALRLQAVAGKKLNIVAFPSAVAARQAVIAGHVAAAALALSDALDPLQDRKLVGLGIAAKDRLEAVPDMPPLRDLGLPLSAFIRRGLAVPAGTPEEINARLIQAMHAVLADPEFTAQANETGTRPFWTTGASWTAQAMAEREELSMLWQSAPWLPTTTG